MPRSLEEAQAMWNAASGDEEQDRYIKQRQGYYMQQDLIAEIEAEFNALPWYKKAWWWVKMKRDQFFTRSK